MRRILVEQARRKGRVRHGGGRRRVDLLEAEVAVAPSDDEQILLLDEALTAVWLPLGRRQRSWSSCASSPV